MIKHFNNLKENILEVLKTQNSTDEEYIHALTVHKWLLKLYPHASEELQIAAFGHDIDRSITPRTRKKENEPYKVFKNRHACRSAIIIGSMMHELGYSEEVIGRVFTYIRYHEVGGDIYINYLCDADSLGYFDYNLPIYLEKYGVEITKEKVAFMYKRASDIGKTYIKSIAYTRELYPIVMEVIV